MIKSLKDKTVIILRGRLKGFEGYVLKEDNMFVTVEVANKSKNEYLKRIYLKDNVTVFED